jgi:hypothetical protein
MGMSSQYNNQCFKISHQKTPSEIASDLFQDTFVESAYDNKGKFSHLLARLPQSEFVRLYSAQTTASIFIQGYWLQLCLQNNKKKIINRDTQIQLEIEVSIDSYGYTLLTFIRFNKNISRFKLKNITAFNLLNSEEGYHYIARAAVKVFAKVVPSLNYNHLSQMHLPVVLVLMNIDKKIETAFDSKMVLIQ